MINPDMYDPDSIPSSKDPRPTLLLKNYRESHHPFRRIVKTSFKGLYSELEIKFSSPKNARSTIFEQYLNAMGESKFVLSPPGEKML